MGSIRKKILVTGVAGLVGSETAKFFGRKGFEVIGVENDSRAYFYGNEASTKQNLKNLMGAVPRLEVHDIDIRDFEAIRSLVARYGKSLSLVVHAAAQPSHDWAARSPIEDFDINARATLNLLESMRKFGNQVPFAFMSTNKVYGDAPNSLPLIEGETRWSPSIEHPFHRGIDESMAIDGSTHSLFGVSKASADLLTQEYGKYFGLPTMALRAGCITGGAHRGAKLHGFLSFLIGSGLTKQAYSVIGHKGKQVRDNIHAADLATAFLEFSEDPTYGEFFNIGGGATRSTSVIEAIETLNRRGIPVAWSYESSERKGDHKWWITDFSKFSKRYPNWEQHYSMEMIYDDIIQAHSSVLG